MSKQFYAEGAYTGTVLAQGFSESREKKTPFFFIRVRIDSHEDGSPVEKSYERSVDKYITEATVPYLIEDLKVLGYESFKSFNDLNPDNPSHLSFVGRPVSLWCKHDGEYEKWNLSRPSSGQTAEPLAPNKMRQLDTMFGRAMKAGIGTVASPAPRPAAASEQIDDDDLPF